MRNSKNKYMGTNEVAKDGDVLIFEADLRSKEREKRTLKMFVNGRQQKYFFYNLPDSVRFCVCYRILCKKSSICKDIYMWESFINI